MNRPDIRIIGASAGTGKTTRLAEEFLAAVDGRLAGKPFDADKILVSTFTNKAADELVGRIRRKLIEKGNSTAAQLVRIGYVGTVNSICSKILKDFAFEAGLSPMQNVIPPQMEQAIFSIATDPIVDSYSDRINDIAIRLGFDEPPRNSGFAASVHWSEIVKDICVQVRANRIAIADLSSFAQKSWQEFSKYLRPPKAGTTADELDAKLIRELERSINSLQRANDSTKKTQDTLQSLRDVFARSRRKPLSWSDWAILARSDVSKSSSIMIVGLVNTANDHPAHPRLHQDSKQFIELVFQCAGECLAAYQEYKANAGLVDFTDQEYLALKLLEMPQVQESLRDRVSFAMIDEFQDTSPIQLSLFLKLADLVEQSIWVGDTKQAIYGFRGTDPQLMQAAESIFCKGQPERLTRSYRSKKTLVDFCNNVFSKAFAAFGFDPASVEIEAARNSDQSPESSPDIELWRCDGLKLDECHKSLAASLRDLLERKPLILDKSTGAIRALLGSDIAILCHSNDRSQGVAEALSKAGIEVAMTRDGLLDTPECLLSLATLSYLVDRSDRLALATIIHLSQDYANSDQSQWFTQWLQNTQDPHVLLAYPELNEARQKLPNCTTSEALQLALTCGHVLEKIFSWGNVGQRSANIDSLTGLVAEYESLCTMEQSAASPAGFITFIEHLKQARQSPSTSKHAVNVLTYHASKGLEWPVVILTDLDKSAKPEVHKDLCTVAVESPSAQFDPADPLASRWIRFWPWPYGRQEQNVYLDTSLLKSKEYASAAERLHAENVRLLYVGITRARDLLVLAPYVGRRGQGNGLDWLNQLQDQSKKAFLRLPHEDGVVQVQVGDAFHPISAKTTSSAVFNEQKSEVRSSVFFNLNNLSSGNLPFLLKPSEQDIPFQLDPASILVTDIGSRIPLTGSPDMQLLGDCVHRFLAADLPALSLSQREELAERLRLLWMVPQIDSQSMIELSDRFQNYVANEFANPVCYRECPVTGRVGNQRVHGVLDLLLETNDTFIIFDHKTFPGAPDKWVEKALTYAGQLKMYADILLQSAGKPVNGLYIHMPIVGKVLNLTEVLKISR